MLHPWLFPVLPTMFVLLLLLFQPWHTRDAQEGVVGVPIPDQQLLVWRNHLEREMQMEVLGEVSSILCTLTGSLQPSPGHIPTPVRPCCHLTPANGPQRPLGRHSRAQAAALEALAWLSTMHHQHKPALRSPPG